MSFNIFPFNCDNTNNYVSYRMVSDTTVIFDKTFREDEHIEFYIKLIIDSCKELKKYGVQKIIQYIDPSNWKYLEPLGYFTKLKDEKDYCEIVCDIDKFPYSLKEGLKLAAKT